jgi:dihydroneopterin aldolase
MRLRLKMSVDAIMGIRDSERRNTCRLLVEIEWTSGAPLQKDAIVGLVDYSLLARRVRDVLVEGKFNILEVATQRVAAEVRAMCHPTQGFVRITKPLEWGEVRAEVDFNYYPG